MTGQPDLAIQAAVHAARTHLTFPNEVARRLAEAAIDRERERQIDRRKIGDKLGSFERPGRIVELGEDCYVVEIITNGSLEDAVTWGAMINGRKDHYRFYTLDEALLRAVELRNGGGANDQGHVYAARMLGAGIKPTEETR